MAGIGALKNELKRMEDRRASLSRRLDKIKQEKLYLERKLIDLSKLYTITKEMSFDIRFNELFSSLRNFIKDNFQFEKFKIVLFKYEKSKRFVDKVYEIGGKIEDKSRDIMAIPLVVRRRVISEILIENISKDDYDKFLILTPQVALQIERIKLFDEIERLSIMDGLTGTYLRRYFLERLKEELSRAKQYNMDIAFIMVDLDHFKKCNDSFGHLVGDVVLKEVAGILKQKVREIDLVGRFGGEEFCILLPEANKADAYVVAERIRKAVEGYTIKAYDETLSITISMGISSFPEDSPGLEDLIENADTALYEAKRQGRNKVCLVS